MADAVAPPLAAGSVSLRLYPHNDLPAHEIVTELRAQAVLAADAGFDGVMTSEHHAGFAGYLPNPLQAAGWLLEAMPRGWAAACPLLLPLRPTALVVEEVAWLAARFPGRVGLGVAAGALPSDFELMGTTKDDLTRRFTHALDVVTTMLGGHDAGPLAGDPAVRRCADHPVPVVSAAASTTAARRAASFGAGIVLDSLSAPERCRELTVAYRDAGGTEACILIRRAWLGAPPTERQEQQLDVYRSYTPAQARDRWSGQQLVSGDAGAVAAGLAEAVVAAGADALNIRVHVPGVPPDEVRAQITALADVVAQLRTNAGLRFPSGTPS